MIEILDETKQDLIAVRIKGKVTKQDYDKLKAVLEKTVKDFKSPKAYLEIHDLEIPEFQAVWEDIKAIPTYNNLEKCAVVGTKDWYETMTKIFAKVISPEVKYFNYDEKADAMEWLKAHAYQHIT